MVRFVRFAILALCAIVLLGFAFANRDLVTVSFDPFASSDSAAFSIAAPLFAVVIVAAMLGVVAGASATWLSQGRHRKLPAKTGSRRRNCARKLKRLSLLIPPCRATGNRRHSSAEAIATGALVTHLTTARRRTAAHWRRSTKSAPTRRDSPGRWIHRPPLPPRGLGPRD